LERELGQIGQQLKQKLVPNGKIPRSRKDKTQQETSLLKRQELFARIRQLRQEGMSISEIARTLKVARGTVHVAIRANGLPEARQNHKRKTSLDGYEAFLKQRFSQGCQVAQQLWLELKEQGYQGSYAPVRRWVYRQKHAASQTTDPNALKATPKQLTYLLLRDQQTLKEDQRKSINDLCSSLPILEQLREFTLSFKEALLQSMPDHMDQWLEQVKAASFTFLRAFADGLQPEWGALKAACTLSWSNGPTEGLVNRIKLVKRQMYGRGSFDLLRKRVLLTSAST
jgi:transposase